MVPADRNVWLPAPGRLHHPAVANTGGRALEPQKSCHAFRSRRKQPVGWIALIAGAALAGLASGWALERLIARERAALQLPPVPLATRRLRPAVVAAALVAVGVGLVWSELVQNCLDTPEVQPTEWGRLARAAYHFVLAAALIFATVVDLDCYLIPDQITLPGMAIGVVAAVAFADLQIAHLWVDWSYAIPQLRGPLIPEWYVAHPRWHAAAWSLAGLIAGGALTQLVRRLSSRILGQETMGFGDVTLMALIGCFLGWQAVVLTFVLATLTGLLIAVVGRLAANRPCLPYGPCLSAAALAVLFGWRWLWAETRLIFSDGVGLGILAACALAALTVLLLLLRLYRHIPTGR